MVIATIDSKIIGFLQLLKKKSEYFIIDLIATDKKHQKKGVAKSMIDYAQSYYSSKQIKKIVVGTQIANIPSIKFYQKLGFIIKDAKYVFHYHN